MGQVQSGKSRTFSPRLFPFISLRRLSCSNGLSTQCGPLRKSQHIYIHRHTDILWHTVMYFDILGHAVIYFDILWHTSLVLLMISCSLNLTAELCQSPCGTCFFCSFAGLGFFWSFTSSCHHAAKAGWSNAGAGKEWTNLKVNFRPSSYHTSDVAWIPNVKYKTTAICGIFGISFVDFCSLSWTPPLLQLELLVRRRIILDILLLFSSTFRLHLAACDRVLLDACKPWHRELLSLEHHWSCFGWGLLPLVK